MDSSESKPLTDRSHLIRRGYLMPIGGAEDKHDERVVLRRFVALAGGKQARIVVMPTASSMGYIVGQRYIEIFKSLGAKDVEVVLVNSREQAMDEGLLKVFDQASGIFLTGGNQLKLSAMLGGTPVLQKIRDRYSDGVLVGGTSAGASAISQHMIAYGTSGGSPKHRMVQLCPGIGLLTQAIVDQHFSQRDRIGRLLTAVAHNPFILGIGIDEDTAAVIDPDKRLEVVGRGSVLIVDASGMTYTDIHEARGSRPVTMYGVTISTLTAGYKYDLIERKPIL